MRPVNYLLFPLALLLAHAPSTAHGQQLVAGDAIRVRASQSTEPDRQWIDATVARLTPDTLWYQSDDIVSPISIDNAEIRRRTHTKIFRLAAPSFFSPVRSRPSISHRKTATPIVRRWPSFSFSRCRL